VINDGIAGIVSLVADRYLSASKKGQKDGWQKDGEEENLDDRASVGNCQRYFSRLPIRSLAQIDLRNLAPIRKIFAMQVN
jgi:hypothetical protein